MAPIISLKGVTLSFGADEIYSGIDLEVRDGEFLCLLGPSGCGKSTILRLVSGLISPTGGVIRVRGKTPQQMRDQFAFVFQNARLAPWRSAASNVALAATLRFGTSKKRAMPRALEELRKVGLEADADKMPAMMSGGERQRVAIARALMVDPAIILMDEPFSALDVRTRNHMRREIQSLSQQMRKTIVFVTHDIDDAVLLADRVVVFSTKPTRIVDTISIDLPHGRDLDSSPELKAVRRRLSDLLHQGETTADVHA